MGGGLWWWMKVWNRGIVEVCGIVPHRCCLSCCSFQVPNMMATSSVDKTVKIWDIEGNTPVCVETKKMGVGDVFTVSYYGEDPFLLACGGEDGKVALWETSESTSVSRKFRKRAKDAQDGKDGKEGDGEEEAVDGEEGDAAAMSEDDE